LGGSGDSEDGKCQDEREFSQMSTPVRRREL
jgi:hypothetical protein